MDGSLAPDSQCNAAYEFQILITRCFKSIFVYRRRGWLHRISALQKNQLKWSRLFEDAKNRERAITFSRKCNQNPRFGSPEASRQAVAESL